MRIWLLHELLNGKLKSSSADLKLECHTDQWLSLDFELTFNLHIYIYVYTFMYICKHSSKTWEHPESGTGSIVE